MKTLAIHQKDDWYLINLPGFNDTNKDAIEIEARIAPEEIKNLDYKETRGIMIMDRYYEKRCREEHSTIEPRQLEEFCLKFGLTAIHSMDDVLKLI